MFSCSGLASRLYYVWSVCNVTKSVDLLRNISGTFITFITVLCIFCFCVKFAVNHRCNVNAKSSSRTGRCQQTVQTGVHSEHCYSGWLWLPPGNLVYSICDCDMIQWSLCWSVKTKHCCILTCKSFCEFQQQTEFPKIHWNSCWNSQKLLEVSMQQCLVFTLQHKLHCIMSQCCSSIAIWYNGALIVEVSESGKN